MEKSRLQLTKDGEEKCLCTTVPRDLIISLKFLAKKRGVRISYMVIEAIHDLLIKYEDWPKR